MCFSQSHFGSLISTVLTTELLQVLENVSKRSLFLEEHIAKVPTCYALEFPRGVGMVRYG